MSERLEHTLRALSRLPNWDRYSVDDWCLEVARAARCGVEPVRAVARSLGLYGAEPTEPQRPLRLRHTHLTSAQAGALLGVHCQHVINFARAGRLTRYREREHTFWDPAEVEQLAQELARAREQAAA